MQQQRKFGAFAGVFTPSILTILGVIMYLRLGWVVGVSGLWGSIIIILLAHVISVSTGLSISSIATDKKIKAGGIYYILSRSLGLPMGGSIGITLFVGTALSISMYIVGFTENFLSVEIFRNLLGINQITINDIRIIGTIVLVLLTVIAFISTDLAIKTQFFILGAIFLSLVSIFAGIYFFYSPGTQAVTVTDFKAFKDFGFAEVFAIFFPAVTGFTAGVAMSGDLKNPKKDIPKGTMLSILTGLVVYITLAVVFYYKVDKNLLINDYNFLLKISWLPFLVIAGIWGATLSSALGGILGAPRIIQAIAKDKIVPRPLAKGHGPNREPRNALIFTFILSELGILVGDLNAIAGLVTIFYLTAYGFINLSFTLEKWASTDFRPGFRIPTWIGIIGFFASFMIMFKLDAPAMFAAFLILGIIFYYIRKKKLQLGMGDVWPSVLASMIQIVLHRYNSLKIPERNWRANILLFSGGMSTRPHLVTFSKWLVGKYGLISNFDLVLNTKAKKLFPTKKVTIPEDEMEGDENIFSKRQECNNIYDGIESISAIYGFSGVEPNTIVMGWGRHSENPVRFAGMLKYLMSLDLNIVMLDYNKERGFGKYELIDVWLRGGSNNGNLILSLIRFIHLSYEWRKAKVRILIIDNTGKRKERIVKRTLKVLENMRIQASIHVIDNGNSDKSVREIIINNSINTDLVFLGLATVQEGKEEEFMNRADQIYSGIGTIALVKASSFFSELHIGD
jgi:amino acid transporter